MQKIWDIKKPDIKLQNMLVRELDISPLTAQLLINRNIVSPALADAFLSCKLSLLHDPFLLKDMARAVARIKKAVSQGEKIIIWGDYDVDGITSITLLVSVLSKMGAKPAYYLPNRLSEGYGLNKEGIRRAHQDGVSLLITVDCGITAVDEIKYLNERGIDTIITDHHHPGGILPAALAIIDPLQRDCSYPYKELSGVGLAFKLAQALFSRQSPAAGHQSRDINSYLDLVALGTVADVSPITGENRILVKHGLAQLGASKRKGIKALIDLAGLAKREITVGHIGYILGPRINAAGRLGLAESSLELLLSSEEEEAYNLAKILDRGNRERQRLEEEILAEAIVKVEKEVNFKYHKVIVLSDENWHPGVIGIVASRLVDRFYRPTIMVSAQDVPARGSGRSIRNFHLFDALGQCEKYLKNYGGHKYAVGITLLKENLAAFKESINDIASRLLSREDLVPRIDVDLEVCLEELNDDLVKQLEAMAPFGSGNPRPLFCSRNLELKTQPSLVGRNHLKLWVHDKTRTCEAIGFRMAGKVALPPPESRVDLLYSPSFNHWDGMATIQLELKDMRVSK